MVHRPRSRAGARPLWLAFATLIGIGSCGGDKPATDTGAGAPPGDGAAGAGGGGGQGGTSQGGTSGSGASDAAAGAGGARDAGPSDGPPAGAAASRRIVAGRARLVGTHTTACSHQPGSPEQWCAFSLPGDAGKTDLWVINVTRALTADVPCNGMDPNCLRLTADLWTGMPTAGPVHPLSHRFRGDTLLFFASTPATVPIYKGPIFAWRPGWSAARQITGANAADCTAHPRADVAICVEDVATVANVLQFDLHGGRLGTSPLPLVARVVPFKANGASQWEAAFTTMGDYLAYSTGGATAAEPETLFVTKVDDVGMASKRITLGANLSQWDLSADGKRWYYFRDYNYPPPTGAIVPVGTLVTADFPAGGNEATVAPGVTAYFPVDEFGVDRGVALLDGASAAGATYKMVRDPLKPAEVTTISAGVGGLVISPDLRYSILQTRFNSALLTSDAQVIKNDGTGRCALAAMPTADDLLVTPFLPHSGLVVWADNINATGFGEGWLANPDGCTGKQKFADAVDFWFPAGDSGLVYSDTASGVIATIRYAKLGPGAQWPAAGPVTIREKAGFVYAPLGPNLDNVVYYLDQGGADDGLYVYGPIGFTRP
jgi:hypothetical protein